MVIGSADVHPAAAPGHGALLDYVSQFVREQPLVPGALILAEEDVAAGGERLRCHGAIECVGFRIAVDADVAKTLAGGALHLRSHAVVERRARAALGFDAAGSVVADGATLEADLRVVLHLKLVLFGTLP